MIELYLLVGVLCASYEFYDDLSFVDRIDWEVVAKYFSIFFLWLGYIFYMIESRGIITELKTNYLPKLKSWIDRKRGKETASE